jgi:hypothetical protein
MDTILCKQTKQYILINHCTSIILIDDAEYTALNVIPNTVVELYSKHTYVPHMYKCHIVQWGAESMPYNIANKKVRFNVDIRDLQELIEDEILLK